MTLNERQDYFGQTVNIASRVQGLAQSRSILATAPVVDNPQQRRACSATTARSRWRRAMPLRGIAAEMAVYEIP